MKGNFKVGDKVVGVGFYSGLNIDGREGTIRWIGSTSGDLAVEFNESFSSRMHCCNGSCREEKGWWCQSESLEPILNQSESDYSIFITTKGNETIAVLKNGKETVKIAKAKCSPSDTFSLETGAKLAVERLFETDKPAIKEVKRIAKIGDWVRIVKDIKCLNQVVKKDEIVKITHFGCMPSIERKDFYVGFINDEYVVLENYQPKPIMMDALYGKSEPKTLSDYTDKELLEELLRREN